MPRGFGLAAVRRANFKMPTTQLASQHFILTTDAFSTADDIAYDDVVTTEGGFSSWTLAASPNGPFAETVNFDEAGTVTLYVRAAEPYPLVQSVSITIEAA